MRLGLGIGLDIANKVGGEAAVAPANTVAPAISGTAVVGQVLTTTTGTWTGTAPITYSYQWKRGATNIGTNASTYTLVQADAGNTSNITCVVTATNAVGSADATSNTVAQILDADLNTFLTAAAITDSTIKSAENSFFIARKNIAALNTAIASYHLVTDTATNTDRLNQFKYNAYNPVNADANKRLTYGGTLTANTTGLQGSANGYANTFINTSTNFSTTDFTVLFVVRTTGSLNAIDFGVVDSGASGLYIAVKYTDNNTYSSAFGSSVNSGNVNSGATAIYSFKRSGTSVTLKRNNVTIFTRTDSGTTKVNNPIYLLCRNFNGTGQTYSAREYSFFEFINGALTAQQETDFYNALAAREAALGR
jgi:hypothetical protein